MTYGIDIPLESYRLIQNSQPITCYICDSENTNSAEHCRHCFAPMALAHQSRVNRIEPRTIALVGASAVGKTVYLGMLMDMMSRKPEPLHALTLGAFSISLQQETTQALSRSLFPDKTPNEPDHWNWVHCQISSQRKRQPLDLIVPDMAGEAILDEIDHPNTYPVVRSLLSKCCGVILLVDAIRLQSGDQTQYYSTMKILSFLGELEQNRKVGRRFRHAPRLPIAVVFTKADQCETCFDDPTLFAESHAHGVLRLSRERFPVHAMFACGVAGACAYREAMGEGLRRIPLRVEPRGIVEPLVWMVEELTRR